MRKAPPLEEDATTTSAAIKQQIKRRISFSGKKFVREFVNTKETNNWDDSYEVSEHNAEDSTGSGSRSGSLPKVPQDADKENVPLASHHERESIDMTLNLQTSVDVTMLPGEPRNTSSRKSTTSIYLSAEECKVLQSSLYDIRTMDKTYDLMSQSLIPRTQIPTSICEDSSLELPPVDRGKRVNTPVAKVAISDSFMDITPLGFADPAPAPYRAVSAPVPAAVPAPPVHPPMQQSFMELEDDSLIREMREFTKKEQKPPVQKSLFMNIEQAQKEIKNRTQHEPVDISFDCPLNVSEDRDRSPSNSFESNNSTINFIKDESMLIPFDMISGKNISKKINFRQLNDDLEAGKIQIFPNGPKTPTTDRKTKRNRFFQGLEEEAADNSSPTKDIRSIKPRGTLNFSENMTMSPAITSPVRKYKEKQKAVDDKRKYRLSQADELMLDNTNFLAHAKLGDETQSRNTSKNSTRRETTYENSELNLEYPASSQSFHPMLNSKSRQTINMAEEMQQDQLEFPAHPGVKAVPARRTLHLNESMDQEATNYVHVRKEIVTTEQIVYEKSTNHQQETNQNGTVWGCTKTKRRETILLQESMEQDIISPLKDLHLKPSAAFGEKGQSKSNHTLYLAEPLDEEVIESKRFPLTDAASKGSKSKVRQTMLLEEPMEEEMGGNVKHQSVFNSRRRTLHLAEPLEEEEVIADKNLPMKIFPPQDKKSKARHTLLLNEPMEEEIFNNILDPVVCDSKRKTLHLAEPLEEEKTISAKSLPKNSLVHHNSKSKARQTLLLEEPMEEESLCNIKDIQVINASTKGIPNQSIGAINQSNNTRTKSRHTLTMSEPIEEDKSVPQTKNKSIITHQTIDRLNVPQRQKSRHTLIMSEPIEEEHPAANQFGEQSRLKSRNTLLMQEPIQEDLAIGKEDNLVRQQRFKSRQTLVMAEPIEEDVGQSIQINKADCTTFKASRTLLMSEPIDEDVWQLKQADQTKEQLKEVGTKNRSIKSMPNFRMSEAIEDRHKSIAQKNDQSHYKSTLASETTGQPSKPRQTLLVAEPIEEDKEITRRVNGQTRRQTLINAEPIEEDLEVCKPRKNLNEQPTKKSILSISDQISTYRSSKSRHTLHIAEPIEVDSDTLEPINHHLDHHHRKPRNTLLTHEAIQEDFRAEMEECPVRPQISKHRQTLLMAEPIEEDVSVYHNSKINNNCEDHMENKSATQSGVYTTSKSRHTLLISEPIEEDNILCHKHVGTKTADEDLKVVGVSRKSRTTEMSVKPLSVAPSSKRHTLLLSEPMEEDEESPGLKYPATKKKSEKPKGVLHTLKSYIFGDSLHNANANAKTHQTMEMSNLIDCQSPSKDTSKVPDFDAITPVPNTRILSRIKQLSTYTPGMSLTEFEDQEKMCRTPIHEKIHGISQRKEQIESESVLGTSVRHVLLKRLPSHLTPNLPESKKRHTTHLFADSNMDITMEEEEEQEGAWGTTNTYKSRRTFTVDPMDASVQPIRDYHPAMTELNKKSSLDMLELPRQLEYNVDAEEKPITISDVTNYFEQQKEEQRRSSERESGSSSDRTFKSYAAANSKFINLTGNTTIFAPAEDLDGEEREIDIDKERLSLVSTLAEETDDDGGGEKEEVEEEHQPKPELCQDQLNPVVIAGTSGSCKKCGNCNQTLSETKLSNDSFFLPHKKQWDFTRQQQRLGVIRKKPTVKEVNLYWELEDQTRMSRCQEPDDSMDQTTVEESTWNKSTLLELCNMRIQVQKNVVDNPTESFFERLKRLLVDQQPNWIFDYQRKISQQLIFYHRLLTTFRIVVNYKIEDTEESAISVVSIELDNEVTTQKEYWTSRDHFLNYQLSLRLPSNLTDAIEGSDNGAFLKFLKHIDQRVVEINQTFHKLLTVLTAKRARLLRQANRTIVQKIVRKCIEDEPLVRLEKTTFVIDIVNTEDVSFMDIRRPELHLFNENIQYLPKGIAFLEAFLTDPEQYLKT
ncbi:hypothetical protein KR084_001122 [Drosophila pseudotakahashii]|nr:hypothetical protein KR084_001122 [Drosophila pseudotakahashii]